MNDSRKKSRLKRTLVTLTILLATACTEEPKVGLKDFGTEANVDDIEEALSKATNGTSILTATVDQLVEYETNYKVDMSNVIKVLDTSLKVKEIHDIGADRRFLMKEILIEYNTDGSEKNRKESEVVHDEPRFVPAFAELNTMANTDPDCGKKRQRDDGLIFDCVKFYNFKTYLTHEPVPEKARQRPNCGNIPGCTLPARVVNYDQVFFLNGEFVERENLRKSISKTVPVLFGAPYFSLCIEKLYRESSGASFFVNHCNVLRDLQL